MSFERLQDFAERAGRAAVRNSCLILMATASLPKGVSAEIVEEGIMLSGRGLKRRMIDDIKLRNFGR